LVHALSYVHEIQLFVSSLAPSFRHERISTVGKIYTRMQMQDLFVDSQFKELQTIDDNHGVH
jgi:hypothetical protein